ncbi:hypothetical protein Tco_0908679 [Tanacetum coccineum]|uniref:Uncharacterized protein n=1 Tax=Tanacetum coccineum TaxID=301880 RepID=A0ABQ5CUB4_9ASTR
MSSTGSKFMVNIEDCLEGWVGIKGGVVLGVVKSLLGENPGGAIGVVGEESRVDFGIVMIKVLLEIRDEDAMEKMVIYRWIHAHSKTIGRGKGFIVWSRQSILYLGSIFLRVHGNQSEYEFLKYTPRKRIITARDVRQMRIDDFRHVFQLPQANDNNNDEFVVAPSLLLSMRTWNADSRLDDNGGDEAYKALPAICLCVGHRYPETPIPIAAEVDIKNLDEATKLSIATARSLEDLESQQNVEQVKEDEFMHDNFNNQEDPGTRIEPESHKEIREVMENSDVVNINDGDEEEESVEDALIRRKTHIAPLSSDKETLQELTAFDATPSSSTPTTSTLKFKQDCFKHYKSEAIPPLVDKRVNYIAKKKQKTRAEIAALVVEAVKKERDNLRAEFSIQVTNDVASDDPLHVESFLQNYMSNHDLQFERPNPLIASCRNPIVHIRDHDDHDDDDTRPERESSVKRQRTSKYEANLVGESLSAQAMEELNPSGRSDSKEVASVYQSCQRDPKAAPITLLNQDLFYLKYGNSGPKKRKEKQRENPDDVYSESKIVEVIRTSYDLGHEHKYITEIVVRRAYGKFGALSESY